MIILERIYAKDRKENDKTSKQDLHLFPKRESDDSG